MHHISWPEKYKPGNTDNYVSNEIIVKGLTAENIWKYIEDTAYWPHYYSNVNGIKIYESQNTRLSAGTRFQF